MAAEEVVEEVIVETARMIPLSQSMVGWGMALAGGCLLGYAYTERKLRKKYSAIAEQEIGAMRDHYQAKEIAREEKPAVEKIIEEQGYTPAPIPEPEKPIGSDITKSRKFPPESEEDKDVKAEIIVREELIEENVFDKHGVGEVHDEWDYEEEVRMRRPEYPYVIHVDEQGELNELDDLCWTYYEGDEILVNASDEVVTDVERSVGLSNLDKFGHGSGDANVVYIRNVVLGIEVEIVRHSGKYEEEVLGLKHFDENARRRRRHFDDESG